MSSTVRSHTLAPTTFHVTQGCTKLFDSGVNWQQHHGHTSSFFCIDLRSSARVQWLLQALAENEEKSEAELCATAAHLVMQNAMRSLQQQEQIDCLQHVRPLCCALVVL